MRLHYSNSFTFIAFEPNKIVRAKTPNPNTKHMQHDDHIGSKKLIMFKPHEKDNIKAKVEFTV